MHKKGVRTFEPHPQGPHVSKCAISVKVDSQIAPKILDLGYPLSTENETM